MSTGKIKIFAVRFFIVLLFLSKASFSLAQCTTPISTFPYTEGFEANNGNWFTGGTASDWVWGTPSKPVITGAASGTKCWIVDGLTNSSYANGEASWLQSPCFDFSSLQHPYIKFSIFWETERKYDGATFQYSTDLGASWINVGTISDPVNCLNGNWFNYSGISYLSSFVGVTEGWSGNIQSTSGSCLGGGGSGAWVTANHCMPALAGKANVIFRFCFGAGTTCNNFDGFAIDNINISEAPANSAAFNFTCGTGNTVNFTDASTPCPTGFAWNFGDVASGVNNTSTDKNPSHTFSAPGNYTITLTVSGPDNAPSTITKTVTIVGAGITASTSPNCFGDNNGSISVTGSPATLGPFTYSWNTTPVQNTATATGLTAGSYTVTVSSASGCPSALTIVLGQPAALSHTINIVQPGCGATSGTATITEAGGSGPYTYLWLPSGGNAATATGLAVGNYVVTVTDSHLCTENIPVVIANAVPPVLNITAQKDVTCFGAANGTVTVAASGGGSTYNYSWNTIPVQNAATATNLAPGSYTATVTDNNGCTATATATINEPTAITATTQITNTSCGLNNGAITVTASGGTGAYSYAWSPLVSTAAAAGNIMAGNYAVNIADANNCLLQLNNLNVINIGRPAHVFLGSDTTICTNQGFTLDAGGGYSSYLWQDNSTAETYAVTTTGKYYVTVTNSDNCKGSDTINIEKINGCDDIYFPKAFTPNADNLNDYFMPLGNVGAVSKYHLIIYNRWGQPVFVSTSPYEKWDGNLKAMADGTFSYVWFVTYTFLGKERRQQGAVTILK